MKTRRQLIADELERRPSMRPTAIAEMLHDHGIALTPAEAVEEVREVAQGHDVLVAPPRCRACGFEEFDKRANLPSRCPECRSERIDEPAFTIESTD